MPRRRTTREHVPPDAARGGGVKRDASRRSLAKPERAAQLIERAVAIYENNFTECPEGKRFLEERGITDAGLLSAHRVGYCDGRLPDILPKPLPNPAGKNGPDRGGLHDELTAIGILSQNGDEFFTGCLVFPVIDVEGNIIALHGCSAAHPGSPDARDGHRSLPGRPNGLWNAPVMKTYSELIVVESVIDALSVETSGVPNVMAALGAERFSDADIEDMRRNGVSKIVLMVDARQRSVEYAEQLKNGLAGITLVSAAMPDAHTPNSYLVKHASPALLRFLGEAAEADPPPDEPATQAETPSSRLPRTAREAGNEAGTPDHGVAGGPDGLTCTFGLRTYRVLGLEKGARRVKATVRVEQAGRLHVDTIDFYSARSRRILAQDLCRVFEESPENAEADITRLLRACEQYRPATDAQGPEAPMAAALSEAERAEAERFGRSPGLVERILADYEACGLVGEEPNKLLSYLAAVSRKMDEPLSVLVLSSSGAGKTALQDTTLAFVPPEDLVKLTSLSGKALFYKERLALKHKVLALEEGVGAEAATYAIRNLISGGELVIESTIKDLGSGRLTTMENRVEGPTSVFITTTDPDTDPETRSRFFVISIDESREQTRRILEFQRRRQTLEGLNVESLREDALRVHRNFQRLLRPLAVVNPFADRLTYGDDRLQGRRDQPKYLNLIKAVAFLRQMQKEVHSLPESPVASAGRPGSGPCPYVLVKLEDVRIANKLAHEILGRSLDELNRPTRELLLLLDRMVERIVERLAKEDPDHSVTRTSVGFTRREIREFAGWTYSRVHRCLKELVDLEYVLPEFGRNGVRHRYRLAYEGQGKDGERFMLGLADPDNLAEVP